MSDGTEIEITLEDIENAEELTLTNMQDFLTTLLYWAYDEHGKEGLVGVYNAFEGAMFAVLKDIGEQDLDMTKQ